MLQNRFCVGREDALAKQLGPMRESCCVSSGSKREQACVCRADWKLRNFCPDVNVKESAVASFCQNEQLFSFSTRESLWHDTPAVHPNHFCWQEKQQDVSLPPWSSSVTGVNTATEHAHFHFPARQVSWAAQQFIKQHLTHSSTGCCC